MHEMIAYCGLVCTECPGYIATKDDDAGQLERVAKMWSKFFHVDLKPEDVVCDGCLVGHARYSSHCAECQIRACAIARRMVNCAHCDDYGCPTLMAFVQSVPEARAKLEEIRTGL